MSDTTIDLLSAADITDWHSEHDLLVVGFGAAGACAAIESAQAGNSVWLSNAVAALVVPLA